MEKKYKKRIKAVLNGTEESADLDDLVPDKACDLLRELGFETDSGDWDTNGWQNDYWYPFFNEAGDKYILAGSGFYGGTSFYKDEDE